jgi:hypothetical protein
VIETPQPRAYDVPPRLKTPARISVAHKKTVDPKEASTMAEEKKKCAHPACNCLVEHGKKYCSDYCHDTAGRIEISCNCRHAECETKTAAAGA